MDDRDLRDQLITLLLAGHETTATALAWTFDLLLRHPAALARLTAEVDAEQQDAYLRAVVSESLQPRPMVTVAGRATGLGAASGWAGPAGRNRRDAGDLAHSHTGRPVSSPTHSVRAASSRPPADLWLGPLRRGHPAAAWGRHSRSSDAWCSRRSCAAALWSRSAGGRSGSLVATSRSPAARHTGTCRLTARRRAAPR
jgi:hypothetical protein